MRTRALRTPRDLLIFIKFDFKLVETFIKLRMFETLQKILIISLVSNIKIEILVVPDLPNNFHLIMKDDFL